MDRADGEAMPCGKPRGRPRSAECTAAILRATAAILRATAAILDEHSYAEVSIEEIASRAGVSKQTIYKWWPSKAKRAMEACAARAADSYPIPDTGSVEGDLLALLLEVFAMLRRGNSRATWASLIAASQSDPGLAKEFRETYVAARRRIGATLLERGVARGELPGDTDVEMALDLLYGPIWYRMLLKNGPLDERFARFIVSVRRAAS
jgi:AcrR family transcriptional regulator